MAEHAVERDHPLDPGLARAGVPHRQTFQVPLAGQPRLGALSTTPARSTTPGEPTPKPSDNWLAYHSYGYVWAAANFDALLRNVGANKNYRTYYESLYTAAQPGWRKSQDAFAELAALCRQRHLPLHILLIPELHTLAGNYEFTRIHDLIRAVGKEIDAPVLDLLEAFPASGDPTKYWASPDDAHPNGSANELMAARIDAALRAEHWIK